MASARSADLEINRRSNSTAPTDMDYVIQTTGLKKRYKRHEALRGVDLAEPAGTVLGLLSPNGAGKATTVRISRPSSKQIGGTT